MNILVSVLNYHQVDLTINLIENLQEQTLKNNMFICVGDTQPSFDEEEKIKNAIKKYTNVHYIKLNDNLGYAKGNNAIINKGLELCDADYFLIINPDILLQNPEDLSKLAQVFNRHEKVGIVGPRVLLSSGRQQGPYLKHSPILYGLKHLFPFIWIPFFLIREYQVKKITREQEVWRLMGAFMLVDAKIFKQLGMFHEKTFMYWEEDILAVKLKNIGYKTFYYPDISVIHYHDQVYTKRNTFLEKTFLESMEEYFNICKYSRWKIKFSKNAVKIYNNFWKRLAFEIKKRRFLV